MVASDESGDEYVDINSNNQVEFTRSIDCYILHKLGWGAKVVLLV